MSNGIILDMDLPIKPPTQADSLFSIAGFQPSLPFFFPFMFVLFSWCVMSRSALPINSSSKPATLWLSCWWFVEGLLV